MWQSKVSVFQSAQRLISLWALFYILPAWAAPGKTFCVHKERDIDDRQGEC